MSHLNYFGTVLADKIYPINKKDAKSIGLRLSKKAAKEIGSLLIQAASKEDINEFVQLTGMKKNHYVTINSSNY